MGYAIALYFRLPTDFEKLVESKGLFQLIGPDVYMPSVAYGVTAFIGVPGYLLLNKLGYAQGHNIILYGGLIGVLLSFLFSGHWSYIVFPSIVVSSTAVLILSSVKFNKLSKKGVAREDPSLRQILLWKFSYY